MAKTPKLTDSKARIAERQRRFRARRKVEKLAAEQSAAARYSAPGKLEELADAISMVAYNRLTLQVENPTDRRFSGGRGAAPTHGSGPMSEKKRGCETWLLIGVGAFVGLVLLFAPTPAAAQEEVAAVRLPAGTPIYFEIIESITTRTAKPKKDAHAGYRPVTVNDVVVGSVVENVLVDGRVLVVESTEVQLRVGAGTKKNRRIGRKGILILEPFMTFAVSGQRVALDGTLTAEGSARTGSTITHTILWGGLGLLKKGTAATLEADGAVYQGFTAYPVEVAMEP